jgi:hypothetical protein
MEGRFARSESERGAGSHRQRRKSSDMIYRIAALTLLFAATACSSGKAKDAELDLSVLDDLELATSGLAEHDLSPLELATDSAPVAPVEEPAPPAPRRRTSTRSAEVYSAPAPAPRARVETVRHTKRDAAIGAGAGAVIGAVAGGPRNRVKGAVVGAVVGGVAGGIIGHTVDKSTRVVYDFR